MPELGGNAEYLLNQPQVFDLRTEHRDIFLGATISIPGEMIGANLWDEMVQKTQATGREVGVIISTNGKSILTSKIFEGLGERSSYNGNGKHPPSFSAPYFPHGLKSLYPGVRDLALVHTHPILAEIDHLPTTVMSAADILAYANSTYKALVMIDIGGVHMMMGRNPYSAVEETNANKIVSDAFKMSRDNTNTVAEVRTEIAKGLAPFGIRYYFIPDRTRPEDGLILLNDCTRIPK